MSSSEHLAAIYPSAGSPFQVVSRPTPTPGPTEILIQVKAIAVNPVDWFMREKGVFISTYPAILGSDIAGVVLAAGPSVPADSPKVGSRVAAFAPCFFVQGAPDYGAFQEKVLVPAASAVALPDEVKYVEGSLLPMAVQTVWAGWYSIGLPFDTKFKPNDKRGMLVWGGASSVGSAAVQIAKSMGYTVYVTASEKHHQYMKALGASRVYDYKSPGVVEEIVKAAKEDGLTFQTAYDAVGALKEILDILKQVKGDGIGKVASAPRVMPDAPTMEGVDVKFVMNPDEKNARIEQWHVVFNLWLREKLETGDFVPSPAIKVVEGGLEAMNKALDEWKIGVSGEKVVVEV